MTNGEAESDDPVVQEHVRKSDAKLNEEIDKAKTESNRLGNVRVTSFKPNITGRLQKRQRLARQKVEDLKGLKSG